MKAVGHKRMWMPAPLTGTDQKHIACVIYKTLINQSLTDWAMTLYLSRTYNESERQRIPLYYHTQTSAFWFCYMFQKSLILQPDHLTCRYSHQVWGFTQSLVFHHPKWRGFFIKRITWMSVCGTRHTSGKKEARKNCLPPQKTKLVTI